MQIMISGTSKTHDLKDYRGIDYESQMMVVEERGVIERRNYYRYFAVFNEDKQEFRHEVISGFISPTMDVLGSITRKILTYKVRKEYDHD
jgi:hypothetical protein